MSEKVKLTKEQAKHIDGFIDAHNKGLLPSSLTVSLSLLADTIKYGYEVEPEFKVGDYVTKIDTKRVGRIQKIKGKSCLIEGDGRWYFDNLKHYFRHATPEEIAEEKERRLNKKLDDVLSRLTKEEIRQLINKLDYEYEVNGRIADRLDVRSK